MKYCFECGRLTGGEPLFCNFCGRSYDVKLCPRLHRNPRVATVCRECGSRELSTPHPHVSIFWHILVFLIRIALGSLLVFLSISIAVMVVGELLKPLEVQGGIIVLGVLLIGLWFLWVMLPDWLRKFIRHRLRRKERDDGR
jgi:ribosomal protein L40E